MRCYGSKVRKKLLWNWWRKMRWCIIEECLIKWRIKNLTVDRIDQICPRIAKSMAWEMVPYKWKRFGWVVWHLIWTRQVSCLNRTSLNKCNLRYPVMIGVLTDEQDREASCIDGISLVKSVVIPCDKKLGPWDYRI